MKDLTTSDADALIAELGARARDAALALAEASAERKHAALIGAAFAVWIYVLREGMAKRMAARNGLVYRFLYNKWWFDEAYDFIFVRGARAVGEVFYKVGDVKIIDGLGPNGAAWASLKSAGWLSKFQSGFVYYYAFVMLLGVAGLLTFAILAWGA